MTTWQRIEIGSGERRLCLAMNRWGARRALTRGFRLISRLGDGVFWYMLILLLALFAGQRGLHAALHMAGVGVVAALMYRTLKRWTRRPRPFRAHAEITPYIAPLDEFSFPSGHTLHAVSFTLIALVYFPWLAPLLVPFTVLVAMSRVVLGMHYPSDVLAASFIACALAGGSLWLVPVSWLA
jgi:undecaprenyl-diphosphatase